MQSPAQVEKKHRSGQDSSENMCSICTQPFADGEVVIKYSRWGDVKDYLGHLLCVIPLSKQDMEQRV